MTVCLSDCPVMTVCPSALVWKLLVDYITSLWFFTDTSDRPAAGNDL